MSRFSSLHPAKQSGFTLTELAIVLGVIGIVLASIWSASAMVSKKMKVNHAIQELQTIVSNIRSIYVGGSHFSQTGSMTDITAGFMNAGVFPAEMIQPGQTYPLNPWGGRVVIYVIPNSPGADNTQFEIAYFNSLNFQCSALLSQTSGSGQDSGLLYVYDGTNGWQSAISGNLDVTNFSNCSPVVVAWTFSLKG